MYLYSRLYSICVYANTKKLAPASHRNLICTFRVRYTSHESDVANFRKVRAQPNGPYRNCCDAPAPQALHGLCVT